MILVIHPALQIPPRWLYQLHAHDVAVRDAVQRQANELVYILHYHSRPDFVPIHVLLDATEDALARAQQQFVNSEDYRIDIEGASGAEQVPRLFAIARPRDGALFWFLNAPGIEDCAKLVEDGHRTAALAPSGWRTLQRLYPDLMTLDTSPDSATLRLHLPTRLSPDLMSVVLGSLVPRLAETDRGEEWFWNGTRGGTASFVRTSSGQLVKQFISVYSLCDREPVIEQALASAVRMHVTPGLGQQAIIVPDNEMSSYVLAKRLLGGTSNVAVIHPDELHRLSITDRVYVFADAAYHSQRLDTRIARVSQHREVAGTVVAFDLAPADRERPAGVHSVVRWPFPDPVPEVDVACDARVYSVDPMTNERIPYDAPRRAEPYRTLAWRGPRSDVSATTRLTLAPHHFSYGIQHIGGRIHIVRCNTERLLVDEAAFRTLGDAIAGTVFAAVPDSERDVVLFVRDDGSLRHHLQRIATAVVASDDATRIEWHGQMFAVPLVTTRRGSMQFIKSGVGPRLEEALPIPGPSPRKQLELPLAHRSPRDRPSPRTQLGLPLEHRSPRDGFTAVFLDNAAVTGRAGRDFVVAMAEREHLIPSTIVVFSIVNKLSPSEERFYHQVDAVAVEDVPNGRIVLRYAALIQLRVRSWRELDSVPQIQRLKELLARTTSAWSSEVAAWATALRAEYTALTGATDRVLQFPLSPKEPPRAMSLDILRLRHLLALHQQGMPLADDVARALHQLATVRDFDLLTMFALEPELLHERPIDAFVPDLVGLALIALENDDHALQTNALLVLFYHPRNLDAHARRIARAVLRSRDRLVLPWLALTCALEGPERDVFIEKSADQAKQLSGIEPANEEIARAAQVLAAEHRVARVPAIRDRRTAKERLWKFLRAARSGGHYGWWEIRSFVQDFASPDLTITKLRNSTWDRAASFLEDVLIPVLWSVEHLAGSLRAYGVTDGGTLARLASAAFERARTAHDRIGTEYFQRDELVKAWSDVSRLTLVSTTDFIYAHEARCVLGEHSEGDPVLHRALPDLVQDPIALLLHSLAAQLSEDATIELEVNRRTESHVAHDTIRNHSEAHLERWRQTRPHQLPVIWFHSKKVREALLLVAQNIRQHGDLTRPISARIRVISDRLTMVVDNHRRSPHVAGSRLGLREIRDRIDQIRGGAIEHTDPEGAGARFRCSIELPIEHLDLPAPDPDGG